MADFSQLTIRGSVTTSGDSNWDEARQAWNLAADQQPAAVALVKSADDVVKTVNFARENDLRVAGQGTGHGAVSLDLGEDTILIKTSGMRGVEIGDGTARVEAGVLAEGIGGAAHEKGQTFLPGTSPNVGVVGYTTGGGLSWFGRKYGFACNNVTAIEVVTADGEARTADATSDPDLFWALRGGGGGYAIVTALHVNLFPMTDAYAGAMLFAPELAADGLRRYRDWAADAPEEVGSIVRMLNLPPIPDIPEEIRGKKWLAVTACVIGDEANGEKVIAPLREIGEPVMNSFAQVPTPAISRIAMDPEPPVPGLGHHCTVNELPDQALDAMVEAAGPESDSALLLAEIRQLGGALARAPEHAGALDKLDAGFVVLGIGMLMDPAMREPIEGSLDKLIGSVKSWQAEGGYFNYAERPCDVDAILPEETCKRLSQVKHSWDPDGRILANHQVALATA